MLAGNAVERVHRGRDPPPVGDNNPRRSGNRNADEADASQPLSYAVHKHSISKNGTTAIATVKIIYAALTLHLFCDTMLTSLSQKGQSAMTTTLSIRIVFITKRTICNDNNPFHPHCPDPHTHRLPRRPVLTLPFRPCRRSYPPHAIICASAPVPH